MQNNKIFSILKLHFSQNKSLLVATIISLLLHTFFLTEFTLTLPEFNEDYQTLEMRLVNLPPIQKTTPTPIKEKTSEPKEKSEQPSPEETQTADLRESDPLADAMQNPPAIEQAITELSANEVIDPIDSIVLTDTENESTSPPYQYVETEFEVYRGGDASAAGTARITFSIDKNNTYLINSATEAKGLASLFFDPLIQKSEGYVTENGLRPNYYTYKYGNKKSQMADFAWSDGVLVLHTAKGDKTEKLISDTQDLLSFMYQFMFKPPLESLQISVTNGKNLRTYSYSFEGEEVINTKFNNELKTIHLLKTGSEEDKTEIWFAIDYKYLPVKIRKTEKDGRVIEQIVTNISTTLPQ